MATDGPTPAPMSDEMQRDGKYVLLVGSWVSSNRFESWVRRLAAWCGGEVDWHMYCGRYAVKYLDRSGGGRSLVRMGIIALWPELDRLYRESLEEDRGLDGEDWSGWPLVASLLADDGTLEGPVVIPPRPRFPDPPKGPEDIV